MLVMVQREVGERLAAQPGGRDYGAVVGARRLLRRARVVGRVSPEVFYPRPNVDSVLVEIERSGRRRPSTRRAPYAEIDRLVRAGFSGRRKMLRRSLAGLVDAEAFEAAGVDPSTRAEQLDVVAWGKLAGCQRSIDELAPAKLTRTFRVLGARADGFHLLRAGDGHPRARRRRSSSSAGDGPRGRRRRSTGAEPPECGGDPAGAARAAGRPTSSCGRSGWRAGVRTSGS